METYLMHHGIKGQKWGVRRFQNTDGSLTTRGKARYESIFFVRREPGNPINLKVDKKALKREALEPAKYDKKTGLKLKNRHMSIEEDCVRVNPEIKSFFTDTATSHNCALCTTAYDLRRRGFDVQAGYARTGKMDHDIAKYYKGGKFKHADKSEVVKELEKQGSGARGHILVKWNGGGGHSMAYEVKNGKAMIVDCQVQKIFKNPNDLLDYCLPDVRYMRSDNLTPDYAEIDRRGIVR